MKRMFLPIALLLFSLPAQAYQSDPPRLEAGADHCSIAGDPVHWIADLCMAKLETDDEIAASDCIAAELDRRPADDCATRRHYKRLLCQLVLARGTRTGTVESCMADRDFMGGTVANGGIGN